jgi:hypothetical protein
LREVLGASLVGEREGREGSVVFALVERQDA